MASVSRSQSALIVFAKPPRPGEVKTRLIPALTAEQAAALYRAFVRDALQQYAALEAALRLYVAPPALHFPTSLAGDASIHEQVGDDLGARMHHAFAETFQEGFRRCVIVGTDHPTLPTSYLRGAFEMLSVESPQLCLGPSDDGGYYLLGMNALYPGLFNGMKYSHADVYQQTLDRSRDAAAEVTELPRWYDVDTPRELQRLVRALERHHTAPALPRTRRVLRDIGLLS